MLQHRFTILAWVFVTGACFVTHRLFNVQVLSGERYRELAVAPVSEFELPAVRGTILDRKGRVLARDVERCEVHLFPMRFRERSLLHAVTDLLWILDPGPVGRASPRDLVREVQRRPMEMAARLAALPARRLGADDSEQARSRFLHLVAPEGDLLREPFEREARLRQALEASLGRGQRIRRRDQNAFAESAGSVGEACGLDGHHLGQRMLEELRLLSELAAALDLPDQDAIFRVITDALEREARWVDLQIDREARDAAALDLLGAARLLPEDFGRNELAALAADLRLPPEDPVAAEAALRTEAALFDGVLPAGATDEELEAWTGSRDAVGIAEARGILDCEPMAVLDAWWRRTKASPGFRIEDHLSERRRREVKGRHVGGRSFRIGTRADAAPVLAAVVGPGRLEELGFGHGPTFVRDEEAFLAMPPGLGLLLGRIAPETGIPRSAMGIEARNQGILAGKSGLARRGTDGEALVVAAPAHGATLRLTLDREYCRALEKILKQAGLADPAAIAVVDVATGAIIGAATWPLPVDIEAAATERLLLEEEKGWLIRLARSGAGPASQRLAALEAEEAGTDAELREADFLRHALGQAEGWHEKRHVEVNRALARSRGFHRAIETPHHLPPGSVFKALTMLAGLEAGAVTAETEVDCVDTSARRFHSCHNHGPRIDLVLALKKSCNEYCYKVADGIGTPAIVAFHERMGLFLPVEGLLFGADFVRRSELDDHPRTLAIGMGSTYCAPVRAAGLAASLATGRRIVPYVIEAGAGPPARPAIATPEHVEWMRRGMREVVRPGGTAGAHAQVLAPYRMAAKTGTADYDAPGGETLNQAWFVGYAPADPGETPKIAFAIVQTNTTDKGAAVAHLARGVCEAWAEAEPEARWWR